MYFSFSIWLISFQWSGGDLFTATTKQLLHDMWTQKPYIFGVNNDFVVGVCVIVSYIFFFYFFSIISLSLIFLFFCCSFYSISFLFLPFAYFGWLYVWNKCVVLVCLSLGWLVRIRCTLIVSRCKWWYTHVFVIRKCCGRFNIFYSCFGCLCESTIYFFMWFLF